MSKAKKKLPAANLTEGVPRLQLALRAAGIGWWQWNLRTNEIVLSPEIYSHLGYAQGRLDSSLPSFAERLHPDDRSRVTKDINERIVKRERYRRDVCRLRHKDGSYRWVAIVSELFCDAQGEPEWVIGSQIDITEQKRLEEALRVSEEGYRLFVDSIPVPAWRCHSTGELAYCNRRWQEYTGQTPAQMLGNGWMSAVHPGDLARTAARVEEVVVEGQFYETEYRLRRHDGVYRWHLARGYPVRDADGKVVVWFGTATDIEGQKRAHAELERVVRERTKELHESEARYRKLLEQAPDPIGVVIDEKLVFVNSEAVRLMGAKHARQLIGRSMWEFLPANQAALVRGLMKRVFRTGEKFQTADLQYVRLDGKSVNVEISVIPTGYQGRPALQVISRDITGRQQMEAQLLEAGEREQIRIGQDLHDGVNQQLAGVAYLCDALGRQLGARSAPEAAEAMHIAELLQQAIGQARSVARGLFPVRLESGGLVSALQELADSVRSVYGVTCRFNCRSPVRLISDLVRINLYRIAQEAVRNAVRHGQATRIEIELQGHCREVSLIVRDNGKGLVKRPAASDGMGLVSMRHRARTMRGALELKRVGRWTVLSCSVPLMTGTGKGLGKS